MTKEQDIILCRWYVHQYEQWLEIVEPQWKWLQELGRVNWLTYLNHLENGEPFPKDYYDEKKECLNDRQQLKKNIRQ